MKTFQTITTAVLFSISAISFANEIEITNNKSLRIDIINIEEPSCNGGNNGSVLVKASGGEAPYTFLWNTFPAQTAPKASQLVAGTYFVQVKDARDSIFFKSIKIEDPTRSKMYTSNSSETEITASAQGLNRPYEISLNGEVVSDDLDISTLDNGIHKIIITDVNACQSQQFIQIVELEEIPAAYESEQIISKNNRSAVVLKLLPTVITSQNSRFENNVVIMSDY